MKSLQAISITVVILAPGLSPESLGAAEVINYWDFDTLEAEVPIDVIGGVPTTAVGDPDISTHETYGEAYVGAGKSLNSKLAIPDYLLADVFDDLSGEANALKFGVGNFSYSYWSWDASDLDGDVRGPRVFDCLNGINIGIQLGTNATGIFNYRMDDDLGSEVISNNILGDIKQDGAKWVHIAVNVDRENDTAEIFFDNVSKGSYEISLLAGTIEPGQDMQIGVINGGSSAGAAQQSGLDDLAFYTGLLTDSDRAGLASATLSPNDITEAPGAPFEITEITVDDAGLVTLTWNSKPGALYSIDFSSDMSNFLELVDEHPSGGDQTSFQHSPGTSKGFYRVREP